jgi:hypothetical protein
MSNEQKQIPDYSLELAILENKIHFLGEAVQNFGSGPSTNVYAQDGMASFVNELADELKAIREGIYSSPE